MNTDAGFDAFAVNLRQDVINASELEGAEAFRPDAFLHRMIEDLTDLGELDDGEVCHHAAPGLEVSGYSIIQDDGILDLFVAIHTQIVPPVTVPKADVDRAFRRAVTFLRKALKNYYLVLEESSPQFDMALSIYELRDSLQRIRILLFTDGLTTVTELPDEQVEGRAVSFHVWDIRRLYRAVTSGRRYEPIEIDFVSRFGQPLPCLAAGSSSDDYAAYLTIIPGSILADIYGEYGPRLLELNVRSYLQARGKINRGIKATILNTPTRFLAYNNGISITASELELVNLPEGGKAIRRVKDLQIVNGGQTTASIHNAARVDKVDVSQVSVQAKVTVVPEAHLQELVRLISRYANTQNRVNEADFAANDPFHVRLEELSRTVWAPPASGTQRQTRWFYERARGQYQDALAREATPGRQRQFKIVHPLAQKFTKTDLAKFEASWAQRPHEVSLGAEKNFREFTIRLSERGRFDVDQAYFERLVAKAILFRRAEKLVSSHKFGGYRANIVTYSIAYLCNRTESRLDLDEIWHRQDITAATEEALDRICVAVHQSIISPPGGKNVTEWCKRGECWVRVRQTDVRLPATLDGDLIPLEAVRGDGVNGEIESVSDEERELIDGACAVPAETWLRLSHWAKEAGHLQGWQRRIVFNVGRIVKTGGRPSRKQADQALRALSDARHLGFVGVHGVSADEIAIV